MFTPDNFYERNRQIVAYYREGFSYSDISLFMNLTRSQVAGVVNRAKGNAALPKVTRPTHKAKSKPPPKPVVVKAPKPPKPAEPEPTNPLGIPMHTIRENQCRWVEGEPQGADTIMCGLPTCGHPLFSLCAEHAKISLTPRKTVPISHHTPSEH